MFRSCWGTTLFAKPAPHGTEDEDDAAIECLAGSFGFWCCCGWNCMVRRALQSTRSQNQAVVREAGEALLQSPQVCIPHRLDGSLLADGCIRMARVAI